MGNSSEKRSPKRVFPPKHHRKHDNEHVIEQDIQNNSAAAPSETRREPEHNRYQSQRSLLSIKRSDPSYGDSIKKENQEKERSLFAPSSSKNLPRRENDVKSRNAFERFAFRFLSQRLPNLEGYKPAYEQAGIPLIYESYLSTAFLISGIVTLPTFFISLLLETRIIHTPTSLSVIGSVILSLSVFALAIFAFLAYPLHRRNNFKSKLDNQLAYSFGILGVLAASGMNVERLFERLAFSESNPVLAELAKRFLRNVRLFGMDTESALREVGEHSPSVAFSKMLDSIAIAFKTTGSIHDLVMFESARLFEEKRNKLSKVIGNLGVIAELYITLVVVGPIIFIVMMAIFGLLPSGHLPDPVLMINIIVFVGVPAISMMFVIILDSIVTRS